METEKLAAMVEVFVGLEDWRSAQQTRHRLSELFTVAVWGAERGRRLRGDLPVGQGQARVAAGALA